jgi:SAM-dependent methyltransferase
LHRGIARMNETVRQPHIARDLASRRWKAEKILRLLGLQPRQRPWRILEIGTGTGGIAHFIATNPDIRCEVTSVDVVDLRLVHDTFEFHLVQGTTLPFADASFDVVITNHVIEHVGIAADQLAHLRECRRVLVPDGRGYLSVPNRWMTVEPHFHLPFLSWLPHGLRSPYVRLMGKGQVYDCEPLTLPEIEALFAQAGLQATNAGVEAFRATLAIEGARSLGRKIAARIPDAVWQRLSPWIPTLIYRFSVPPGDGSAARSPR